MVQDTLLLKTDETVTTNVSLEILAITAGEAVMSHRFNGFEPWRGDILSKRNGALIATKNGVAAAYSIGKMQDRGRFFISPGDKDFIRNTVAPITAGSAIHFTQVNSLNVMIK